MIPDGFLFFAHQGGGLLAPENTLSAFDRGASYNPDALELDIQMTRDGEIVVIHDPTVDRTTDGHAAVSALTLEELRRLDAGYHFTPDGGRSFPFRGRGVTVPTLREVFERFPTKLINIDLKEPLPGKEDLLWRTIQAAHAEDRVIVASFDCASLRRFRALAGSAVPTSACPGEVAAFALHSLSRNPFAARLLKPSYQALQVPELHRGLRIVSPPSIRLAHQMCLKVHVWTVDDPADMRRLLSWGVDGIMTDRPDLLAEVLASAQPRPT